jgi:Flp pilus assembly protein TadG
LLDLPMSLFDLDDKVAAAAVAAAGTVIGALIQLRVVWRKEVSERARGVPVTKKSRRGPVLAVGVLLIAAAVGGFALSQYFATQSNRESAALRNELQSQLAQISATAQRLERATLSDHGSAERAADNRLGAEGVAVTTTVGPCREHAVVVPEVAPACAEQDALRVTLCASVPSSAVVTAVVLYARPENSPQPWSDSRVAPGQDAGRARFADKPIEGTESAQTKQVCTGFSTWDGEQAFSARVVVKYVLAPEATEVSRASLVPISGLRQ